MCRTRFVCVVVLGLSIACSRSAAGDLVPGSDARAKPVKDALAALVKQIGDGDLEKAKAEYVGDKADLELLKAYVDGVAAAKAMRAAIRSKLGDHPNERVEGLDEAVARMAVHDFNSVIFPDAPDRASSSADSPLGVGIEFKRVNGNWKVLSLASRPNTPEQHLARLRQYALAVQAITDKINSGAYHDFGTAAKAAGKRNVCCGQWKAARSRPPNPRGSAR